MISPMLSAMASSPSPEAVLSIRASCDRCRLQKLKCHILSSAEAPAGRASCQRCVRAVVPCTFSRRSRSRRTTTDADRRRSTKKVSAGRFEELDALAADRRSVPPLTPYSAAVDQERAHPRRDAVTPAAEMVSFDHSWSQSPMRQGLVINKHAATDAAEGNHTGLGLEDDDAMNELQLFTKDELTLDNQDHWDLDLPPYQIDPPTTNDENRGSGGSTFFEATTMSSEHGTTPRKMLLSLASELNEKLESLQNGPWRQGGALDSYPIGSILYLSQEYTRLATELRRSGLNNDTGPSDQQPPMANNNVASILTPESLQFGEGGTKRDTRLTGSDASDMLMLLSCYITLTGIYTIVLGHFQEHLNIPPESIRETSWPLSQDLGPTSCLGELPMIHAPYGRAHTAVFMVLDSLRQAEDALGLPGQIRSAGFTDPLVERDLAIAVIHKEIHNSANSIQERFGTLGEQVKDIKQLLRERMGL